MYSFTPKHQIDVLTTLLVRISGAIDNIIILENAGKKKAKDIITCPGCNKDFNTLEANVDNPCTSRQHSTNKTQDTITCRASCKVFNTLKDYANHRCAKPPAHVGKGRYMLLTLLTLVYMCF